MGVAAEVYRLTADFPQREVYGLTSQVRRAAVSIPSNIAEGHARGSSKETIRYCSIAKGSLAELETQLLLAVELEYVDSAVVQGLLRRTAELGRMLSGLIRSTRGTSSE